MNIKDFKWTEKRFGTRFANILKKLGGLSKDGTDGSIEYKDDEGNVTKLVTDSNFSSLLAKNGLIEVKWQELKDKRDNGQLIPGALYRITDYQCTTTQENTRSAGHQFDIVLLALSEDKLAEEGWAMQHANDTYFANSNLSAWKVWYCLDNDTARFAWADDRNGRGVIYRLIDEFNNDIKYDFKNIQFKRKLTDGQYDATNGTDTWCYTLNIWYDDMCQDASIVGNTLLNADDYISSVYDNKFGYTLAYDLDIDGVDGFAFALGNNVVLSYTSSNVNDGIYSNTIKNYFYNNTIGNNFRDNIIGNRFNNNIIKNQFQSNTIGNVFAYNTIGNVFQANMIGNIFVSKTIGDNTNGKNYGNNGVELATKDDIGNIETALNNI